MAVADLPPGADPGDLAARDPDGAPGRGEGRQAVPDLPARPPVRPADLRTPRRQGPGRRGGHGRRRGAPERPGPGPVRDDGRRPHRHRARPRLRCPAGRRGRRSRATAPQPEPPRQGPRWRPCAWPCTAPRRWPTASTRCCSPIPSPSPATGPCARRTTLAQAIDLPPRAADAEEDRRAGAAAAPAGRRGRPTSTPTTCWPGWPRRRPPGPSRSSRPPTRRTGGLADEVAWLEAGHGGAAGIGDGRRRDSQVGTLARRPFRGGT